MAEPYVTITREGVRVHVPTENGGELSFVLSAKNALKLYLQIGGKLTSLATPDGKKAIGKALASWLLDLKL